MAQIITRIYATADKAAAAVKEVKTLGYGDSDVFVTGPSAGTAKAEVAAGLAQSGLAKADAEIKYWRAYYADCVARKICKPVPGAPHK